MKKKIYAKQEIITVFSLNGGMQLLPVIDLLGAIYHLSFPLLKMQKKFCGLFPLSRRL
jgi:hypothetical protein